MRTPENLSSAEQRLLEAVRNGESVDYTVGDPVRDDAAQGTTWGTERTIRASVIRALCVGVWPDIPVDPKGIKVSGARIIGILDLESVTIAVPLRFRGCHIVQQPLIERIEIKLLDFGASHLASGLAADGIHVKDDIVLDQGFSATGTVSLIGANIGGQLACRGGRFDGGNGNALLANRMTAKGGAFLNEGFRATGTVSLAGAHVSQLVDDTASWPQRLILHGFEYQILGEKAPVTAAERCLWLRRQSNFQPQPYEHLVQVLRRMGHEREAREIAIAKQEVLRASGQLTPAWRLWSRFLGVTVAHGYKPWRVLWIALVVIFTRGGCFA